MFYNLLADEAAETSGSSNVMTYVFLGIMLVIIIGLFIYSSISNKKKQKQGQEMVNSLKIGDRVKTIGGICGFVHEINNAENTFVLETGTDENKSYVKFDKGAIYQTAPAQGNCVPAKEEKLEDAKADSADVKVEEKAEAKVEEKTEAVEEAKADETPAENKAE